MQTFLDFFAQVAGQWGLLIVFVVTFLETSAMVGLLVPGEITVLLAGALAARGVLDIRELMVVVSVAAVMGDNVGYWIGRRLGRVFLLRHARVFRVKPQHLDRADGYFTRHGGKTVLFGRWVGFLRSLAPFIAGSTRMRYGRFFVYDLVGAVSWAVATCALGYVFAQSYAVVDEWLGRISLFLLFLVVLAVALWFLGRWLWKRREPLLSPANNLADRVLEWRVVRGFRRRFASQIEWFFRRFSPRSAYGLTLTVGLVLAALFAWLFAAVFEGVLMREPITQFDRMVAVALNERAYPLFTQVMKVVTFFGGGVWVATVCTVGVAILAWRKMWRDALVLLTSVAGAALLMTVLKLLVQRPRPDFIEPLVHAGGYSFPSGHATTSAALYLTLGLLAAGWVKRWETRIYILLGSLAVIALIGFSRLYLGVHYVSDVLAGFALGAFWVTLCVTAGTVFVRAQRGLGAAPGDAAPAGAPLGGAAAQGAQLGADGGHDAHTPANHGHDGPDACVFSTARAAILDDDARLEELSLENLEQLLDLHGDEDVADLGSGTGFYAERLASRTTGVVYAVEFQQAMQDLHRAKGPAANVRLVLADLDELPLGPLSLDRALSVSAFHEAHGARGLERLAVALRPGGRFVVVDWRHDPEAADVGPGLHHRMTREQIKETLAPWFRVVASEDVGRHFLAVVAVPACS